MRENAFHSCFCLIFSGVSLKVQCDRFSNSHFRFCSDKEQGKTVYSDLLGVCCVMLGEALFWKKKKCPKECRYNGFTWVSLQLLCKVGASVHVVVCQHKSVFWLPICDVIFISSGFGAIPVSSSYYSFGSLFIFISQKNTKFVIASNITILYKYGYYLNCDLHHFSFL